jgi:MULE transposase domain
MYLELLFGRGIILGINKYVHDDNAGFDLLQVYVQHINNNNGYAVLDVVHITDNDLEEPIHLHPDFFNNNNRFQFISMFVTLSEQKHYSTMAKYICADATHLTGKYKCVLMSASTLDANGRLVILAQAVLPTENTVCWLFFFQHLKESGLANNIDFFISDHDKGLIKAVATNFPGVHHAKCLRHLAENFKKKFGEEKSTVLKQLASVYCNSRWHRCYHL